MAIFPPPPPPPAAAAGSSMCDSSVFLWLQHIRYQTECYEPTTSESDMTTEVQQQQQQVFGCYPFELKHASERRISCEFLEECVEELAFNKGEVVVQEEEEEVVVEEDVMLWKCEIRYAYSSEDEYEEFTQQVYLYICNICD